jgi:hypothetical protein
MSTTWIRVAYGAVLALVLFFTVLFGIAMVLPGPTPPGDPGITFRQLTTEDTDNSQNRLTASIDQYFADAKNFRDDFVNYQRNFFLAAAGLAVLLALIGVALPAAVNYMRWGLLVGAALIMIWVGHIATMPVPNPAPPANSVLAMVAAGEPEPLSFAGRFLRFAISFVSLILLLFIGLWRLTEWPAAPRKTAGAPASARPTTTAPAGDAAAWAPATVAPAAPDAPTATSTAPEAATVASEPPPQPETPPAAPPGEAARWQRPSDPGEPNRQPDTTV